jgi:hypothetical protein
VAVSGVSSATAGATSSPATTMAATTRIGPPIANAAARSRAHFMAARAVDRARRCEMRA